MKTLSARTILIALTLMCTCSMIAQLPPLPELPPIPGNGPPWMQPDSSKNKWVNIAYATKSQSQKLDIHLPEEGPGPYPVIISIHGGAFMLGDKGDFQNKPMLKGLEHGYAVVCINYRLSNEAKFPAPIHDVKTAIRFIKAHAAQYHLNADKIALWGNSAGGYLAALAGTTQAKQELEDKSSGNEKISSKVQAIVDWYGPIDFLQMDAQLKATGNGKPNHSKAGSPESRLMGKQITLIPEQVKKANPTSYISKNIPPFLIQHGTIDKLVPTQQSIEFAEALLKVAGKEKVTLKLLEGANHGGKEFETPENLDLVFQFLDKYLK